LERLGRDGWHRLSAAEQDQLIGKAVGGQRDRAAGRPGKDPAQPADAMPPFDQSGLSSFGLSPFDM
jgi:hypothetical protein